MKKIFLLLVIVMPALHINAGIWPEGTQMDAFFSNITKVDIQKLGKQYVITD